MLSRFLLQNDKFLRSHSIIPLIIASRDGIDAILPNWRREAYYPQLQNHFTVNSLEIPEYHFDVDNTSIKEKLM